MDQKVCGVVRTGLGTSDTGNIFTGGQGGPKVSVVNYAERSNLMPSPHTVGRLTARHAVGGMGRDDGFDFLGQHLRKYRGKLIIAPSKNSVKAIVAKTRKIIKYHAGHTTLEMVRELNPVIRGWANYHRHVCSKKTFRYVDSRIFHNLWNWAAGRHRNKKVEWIRWRYFRAIGNRRWCFFASQRTKGGNADAIDLFYMSTVKIVRHIKIRGMANPYDDQWQEYFSKRSIRTNYPAIEPEPCG